MKPVFLLAAWVPVLFVSGRLAAESRRPNVLILVGDDHSAEALGGYGSPVARTPSLDRLAREGVRFDRAYCNSPICTPSRQSFLTGRYPHSVGVTLLTQALDDEAYTLAERLRDAGYRTGAFGKMHFNSDKSHGFDVFQPESAWREQDAAKPHRPLPAGVEVLPPWKPFVDPAHVWLNSMHAPFGRYDAEMPGTWYARKAVEFMTTKSDKPFYAHIGFHEPHSPFWFPVDFAQKDRFKPAGMPVPEVAPGDRGQIPKVFADLTPAQKQGIVASYYTSVAFLDLNIGRVLAALEHEGLANDTLVVYLGDNGYHLGHHGRFEKHTLYERCVRVPLILRFPGRIKAERSTPALVELVDVVPTVLDYLGLPAGPAGPPRDLHGHSLRPLIEGRVDRVRDVAFSEYLHTEEAMARTDRYKLIYRTKRAPVDWYEPVETPKGRAVRLYDLQADPEELRDIAGDPANAKTVSDLLDRLAGWYRRTPPMGETPPPDLSREEFLDWAIAARNVPR